MKRVHPRSLLSEKDAIEIYQYRKAAVNSSAMRDACLHGKSSAVAEKYKISPKTVRDIWNRRTWIQETRHLWSEDEKPMIRTGDSCRLSRCSRDSSTHVEWWATPSSSECIVLGSAAWMSAAASQSCSVYTTDTDMIKQFCKQATLPSTALSSRCWSQSCFGADNLHSSIAQEQHAMWEPEWGDGPLAGEVSDPFFAEWPIWPNLAVA